MVLIGFGNERKNEVSVLNQLQGKINYQRAYAAWWGHEEDPNAYWGGRPWPMVDGKADMDAWNELHWSNLRSYIENARDRGIIVGLTIWEGHTDLPGGSFGNDSVWNARYNHQGVQWAYDERALARFPTPRPTRDLSERLVYYQRRWIDRLINEVKDYPNVIIELDNETLHGSEEWWLWWADYFIKNGNFVIATTCSERYTISDATFAKSKLLDMKSYHTRPEHPKHVMTPKRLSWNKVIVVDADNQCSNLDETTARKNAWKSFISGGHWNDFVCHKEHFPDSIKIQSYENLLNFVNTREIPFVEMYPIDGFGHDEVILSKPGYYYLTYSEQDISLDLMNTTGLFAYEWYNTINGETIATGHVQGGSIMTFQIPRKGDFILWVYKMAGE